MRLSLFPRAILVCMLFSQAVFGQARFVHTSDTHFNPNRGADTNATRNQALFEEISSLSPIPLLAMNTGDLVEVGALVEYGFLAQAVKHLSVPYLHAPGNHDVRWNPLGKEGFVKGVGQPLFQTFEKQGIQFFLLDSTVLLEHWGHISRQQLDWLAAELKRIGTEKPVVIGFHHPIGRDKTQVDNEQDLIDLVEPYNVILWLQGHGHSDLLWSVDGVPAIMQKGLYQGSYSVMDIVGDRLHITRRTSPPESKGELLKQPASNIRQGVWKYLGDFPMKRPARPTWSMAAGGFTGKGIRLTVDRGDLPTSAKLSYRVDGGKFQPLRETDLLIPAESMQSGKHVIAVQAELSDGRAYQQSKVVEYFTEQLRLVWQTPLNAAVQSRLVRSDDALYVTTMAGDVARLDPNDGRIVWKYTTGDSVFSSPHLGAGVAYVGSADHHLHAINTNDGSLKWKFKTEGAVLAGPAEAKGIVCVGSADTKIYGVDASSGQARWTVQGGNLYQSKTATDGARFYLGGWDNYFRCIDAETGREVWRRYLGREQKMLPQFSAFAPAIASPTIAEDLKLVFVSTNDGILHALDTTTGETRWKIDRKKMGYSSPLYHEGVVYGCLSEESIVFAADARKGEIKWEKSTGHVVYDSSFCWANGQVVIGCVDGTVISFDSESGNKNWEYRLDHGHLLASPAGDDANVYIASMLGNVTAIPVKR